MGIEYNQIIWEIESDIDKNLSIINKNNDELLTFADKISKGVLLWGYPTSNLNISAIAMTTNLLSKTFWVPQNNRMIKIVMFPTTFSCSTAGYPYSQQVDYSVFIDGVQKMQIISDYFTITDGTSRGFRNGGFVLLDDLTAGNHTIDVYAKKSNAGATTPVSTSFVYIEDIGEVIAES